MTSYTLAIELYKDNSDKAKAYYNRGNAYLEREKYTEAIADYENALILDPNLKEAKLNQTIAESKRETQKAQATWEEFQRFYGDARSIGLAKEYEKEQERLKKSCRTWTLCFIGGIVLLVAILAFIIFLHGIEKIKDADFSILKSIVAILPLTLPLIWITSFFARRRGETNMLLQEYTHKTIFANSYIAYKTEIEKHENQDPALLQKLLHATIETLKQNPAYIFNKKRSSDMPIEELQK